MVRRAHRFVAAAHQIGGMFAGEIDDPLILEWFLLGTLVALYKTSGGQRRSLQIDNDVYRRSQGF